MPEGDQSKDLQDLLKELLASASTDRDVSAEQQGTEGFQGGETQTAPSQAPAGETQTAPSQAPAGEIASGQSGGPSRQPPAYEVEIIPPEATGVDSAAGPVGRAGTALHVLKQRLPKRSPVLLEGKLEVHVAPPAPLARVSLFERALKERDDIRWLGTWGKSREGTIVHLQLSAPVLSTQLFEGIALVDGVEKGKGGKTWLIKISLAPDRLEAPAIEDSTEMTLPQAVPEQPELYRPEPSPVYLEPLEQGSVATVDVEVSPIDSLDALNRFERLLASCSLGCRVANVLSLDGVSTVLITVEGVSRDFLAKRLQEKIGAIKLEVSQGRLVAQLPEKW